MNSRYRLLAVWLFHSLEQITLKFSEPHRLSTSSGCVHWMGCACNSAIVVFRTVLTQLFLPKFNRWGTSWALHVQRSGMSKVRVEMKFLGFAWLKPMLCSLGWCTHALSLFPFFHSTHSMDSVHYRREQVL